MEAFFVENSAWCNNIAHSQIVGILIINAQGELLLRRKQQTKSLFTPWETPYLTTPLGQNAHTVTVMHFLATHGLTGSLHAAFSVIQDHTVRHFIIAVLDEMPHHTPAINVESIEFLYRPINEIISDAQNHPQTYALWLLDSLDGVALYLKNLLKQSTMLMKTEPSKG
jgi:hypothetical protein